MVGFFTLNVKFSGVKAPHCLKGFNDKERSLAPPLSQSKQDTNLLLANRKDQILF